MFVGTSDTTVGPEPDERRARRSTPTTACQPPTSSTCSAPAPRTCSRPTSTAPATTPAAAARRPTSATAATTAPGRCSRKFYGTLNAAQQRAGRRQLHRVRPDRLHHQPRHGRHRLGLRAGQLRRRRARASCTSRCTAASRTTPPSATSSCKNTGYTPLGRHQQHHRAVPADQGRQHQPPHRGQRLAGQPERLLGLDRLVRQQLRAEGRHADGGDQGDGRPGLVRRQRRRRRRHGALPAPTGVATSGATTTSMKITWARVTGAAELQRLPRRQQGQRARR